MLWNWNTVDTCFLSSSWHVRSKGMFAGSIVGVFFLVIAIEALRRAGREYDRRITKAAMAGLAMTNGNEAGTPMTPPERKGSSTDGSFAPLSASCGPTQ
jgi:copper transporter 1